MLVINAECKWLLVILQMLRWFGIWKMGPVGLCEDQYEVDINFDFG